MAGLVTNLFQLKQQIDALIVKAEDQSTQNFRRAVWAVFCEILDTTPQFSGKAVASWNIGLGAPDYSFDPTDGEQPEAHKSKAGMEYMRVNARHVGDKGWINVAKERNGYKIRQIQRTTRVFISNGVKGDTNNGKSSESYLLDLQSPTYWVERLRKQNKPYETVSQVLLMESWKLRPPDRIVG